MLRKALMAIIGVVAAIGLIVWLAPPRFATKLAQLMTEKQAATVKAPEKNRSKSTSRAVAVEVATARGAKTTADIRAIGSLRSDESVQITSEVAGRIAEIAFAEGATVNAGDSLVKLDDVLAKAEVADAQARYDLAAANSARAKQLSRTGSVTEKA